MFRRGYLTLFTVRGVPVRAHWTIPLVALFLSGFRYAPGIWVGVILLILWHELGHLFFVLRYRLHAIAVEVNGFGGLCQYSGHPTPVQRSVIAWGGVLFQVIAAAIAVAVVTWVYQPTGPFESEFAEAMIRLNLLLAAFNLIPIPPFDGAEAWKLFSRLRKRGPKPKPKPKSRTRKPKGPRSQEAPGKVVQLKRRADGREVIVIDEDDVKETVREALERAARDARDKRDD